MKIKYLSALNMADVNNIPDEIILDGSEDGDEIMEDEVQIDYAG